MPGGIIVPLSVIASWPSPNYVDPVHHGWGLLTATVLITALSLFVVCARLWARAVLLRNAGIDDWMIVAAIVRLGRAFRRERLKLTVADPCNRHVDISMSW